METPFREDEIIGKRGDEARARLISSMKKYFNGDIYELLEYTTNKGYYQLVNAVWSLYNSIDEKTKQSLKEYIIEL